MRVEETSVSPRSDRNAIWATVFNLISTVLFTVFILAAIYCFFMALTLILVFLPVLALSFLFRYLSAIVNVSFDYSAGNGTLVIGKVINNRKRKQIFEFSAQDILRVTEMNERTRKRKDKKTVVCTANDFPPDGKVFVRLETKDRLIIIEAGEKLLSAVQNKSFY